jgi:hypothetical protein
MMEPLLPESLKAFWARNGVLEAEAFSCALALKASSAAFADDGELPVL